MITIQNLAKAYGGRTLYRDVNLQLTVGNRYGVVGANGSGKSTFARVLAGLEPSSDGDIGIPKRCRLGILRQDRFESDEQRVIDVAMMGHEEVWHALQRRDKILANAEAHFDEEAYSEVEDIIVGHDGYTLESRAGEILEGLGIETVTHDGPLGALSGGFKLRVLLAQALASSPDLLILDEPTNHLDIISIRWLERFLLKFPGVALVVSHDRHFLNSVSTQILDVDYETITRYPGNYEAFEARKVEDRLRRQTEIDKRQKEIAVNQAFVDRFKAKASKARQAQSRAKRIEKIIVEKLPESSRRHPHFNLSKIRHSGREVVKIEGISKAYGDLQVLRDVSMLIRRDERVAIIGPNGVGKSTLLKVLMEEVTPEEGSFTWGHEAAVGYFPQDHKAAFASENATVESDLWATCAEQPLGFVRSQLGRVLFGPDDVEKRIRDLSGGEAARLLFARLAVAKPNVLILDEPTNHLDIESIESLVEALKKYDGTIIFVSHDRWFVSQLATRVIAIDHDGVDDYPGTYEEYLALNGEDHLDVNISSTKRAPKPKAEAAPKAQPKAALSKAKRKQLESERDEILTAIDDGEARQKTIDELFCAPGFFDKTSTDAVAVLQSEKDTLAAKLDAFSERWAEIEELLE